VTVVATLRLAPTGSGSEHTESRFHVDQPSAVARSMPHILTRKIFRMALPAPLVLAG
jgi:hypothetical protein